MDSLVKLTVKTPNQRMDDIQIDCDLKWSVKKLKEYLQDVYPSKPASSSQKLIYLGKLLQDHDLLKEVFSDWGAQTLHLVCSENDAVDDRKSSSCSTSTDQVTPTQEGCVSSIATDTTDGLRHRGNAYHSVPNSMSSMNVPFMTAASSMPNLDQWIQFQQQQQTQHSWTHQHHAHMQQYYHYMQQWQFAMANGQWPHQMFQGHFTPPSTPGSPPAATPTTPQLQPNGVQPEAPPAQAPPNAQNENVRMNAGMGGPAMADDDEDNGNPRNRDWLDWLYMSMRMFMLLSIIFFYSSTSRFLMVALLGFIIYIYQAGWFTPRRRVPPPQVQQQQQPQLDRHNETPSQSENNASEETDSMTTGLLEVVPRRPSALRVLCTFFVSFVTSLIPTAPPVLEQE